MNFAVGVEPIVKDEIAKPLQVMNLAVESEATLKGAK